MRLVGLIEQDLGLAIHGQEIDRQKVKVPAVFQSSHYGFSPFTRL